MHSDLEKLVALQHVEDNLRRVRKSLDELPAQRAQLEQRLLRCPEVEPRRAVLQGRDDGEDDRRRDRQHEERDDRRRGVERALLSALSQSRVGRRNQREMIERYTLPEMGAVWTEENRYRKWLEVELAACQANAEAGLIPAEAVAVIRERANFSVERIHELEKTTDHDVIAFTTNLAEAIDVFFHFQKSALVC